MLRESSFTLEQRLQLAQQFFIGFILRPIPERTLSSVESLLVNNGNKGAGFNSPLFFGNLHALSS